MADLYVDMASFQGVPDMVTARDEGGVRGAIIKLTEGDYYDNTFAARQIAACAAAGLPWGLYGYNGKVYHGVDYRQPGNVEGAYFLRQWVALGSPQVPVFLDHEDQAGDMPQALYADDWAITVEAAIGRSIGYYSYPSFIQANKMGQSTMVRRPLWYASYPDDRPGPDAEWPPTPPNWQTTTLWQFSGGMDVPGIGNCDGSYFHGTQGDFMAVGATTAAETERAALLAYGETIPAEYRGGLTREGVADLTAFGGGAGERICVHERLVTHRLSGTNNILLLSLWDSLRHDGKIVLYG